MAQPQKGMHLVIGSCSSYLKHSFGNLQGGWGSVTFLCIVSHSLVQSEGLVGCRDACFGAVLIGCLKRKFWRLLSKTSAHVRLGRIVLRHSDVSCVATLVLSAGQVKAL